MINFKKFTLANGLRVIVHEDKTTPFVVVNIMYDVGARDEDPCRTGFAHLFEHLMFGGSKNAPEFDRPLELAGAKNNAFTSNDVTNYYDVVPRENLETALWLESDRMKFLDINERTLAVQQKVVIEEFKEHYLNPPYGKVWHLLRDTAYKTHPYRWPTIGLNTEHIAEASLEDVQDFYHKHYNPNQAVLVLTGNISLSDAETLSEKWFGSLTNTGSYTRNLPKENEQITERRITQKANVPLDALYMAFPMVNRTDRNYHRFDLLSDVLSNGKSSRLHLSLVKEQRLFSNINAYITGSIDNGLFIIEGKVMKGTGIERAEKAVWDELEKVKTGITAKEAEKVKNKVEANLTYNRMSNMNKAVDLAFFELLGDACLINDEMEKYAEVSLDDMQNIAAKDLVSSKANIIHYLAQNGSSNGH